MSTYFHEIYRQYPTRYWINNPTVAQLAPAISSGAFAVTTNPAFVSKVMDDRVDGAAFESAVKALAANSNDLATLTCEAQRAMIKRLMDGVENSHIDKSTAKGCVSIQVNPHLEDDADAINRDTETNSQLGNNVIAKIPVTEPGLLAIDYAVKLNLPIIATEVMSISQAIDACEVYYAATKKHGNYPAFFVTHITGIFDDYINKYVAENSVEIDPVVLGLAGIAVARKQYAILKERYDKVIMLGGGMRQLKHFTELVGGTAHVTMNWGGNGAKALLETAPEIKHTIENEILSSTISLLSEKLPAFETAYNEGAISKNEYHKFGPVVLFRDSFVEGWDMMTNRIKTICNI